jgi:dihydroneopterin triphosphate diphosphatase
LHAFGVMAYRRPESVLVVVYTLAGEVLMLRRHSPPDFWQSVTGSLEWSESPREAAKRELLEETGLADDGLQDCEQRNRFTIYPFFRHRYAPDVESNEEHVFRLPLEERLPVAIDPAEHEEFRWLAKTEAAKLARSHTNRDAILRWVP